MATDCGDVDYLSEYRRFFKEFPQFNFDPKQPSASDDCTVRPEEIPGDVCHFTIQFLRLRHCPPSLQAHLVRLVIEEVKTLCQEHCEIPSPKYEKFTLSDLKTEVTNKINEICLRYMDNSQLALLPPPRSAPLQLVSMCAIKNSRRYMEDCIIVVEDLHTTFSIENDSLASYYAVFDGHGGKKTARYCADHLYSYLVHSKHYPTNPTLAFQEAFSKTDNMLLQRYSKENSGATAICALLIDKTLYIAWAGDSQAAICENGEIKQLVDPHRLEREDERSRVVEAGGYIVQSFGTYRINGALNVSRALGDRNYKPYVSASPDVITYNLKGNEDFLVIASDGFWDYVEDTDYVEKLYRFIAETPEQYEKASNFLVKLASRNRSRDNISVIVVFLTPPASIAEKTLCEGAYMLKRMDPDCPSDLGSGFGKLQQASNGMVHRFPNLNLDFYETSNGSHENGTSQYNDNDELHLNLDLGLETNVDDDSDEWRSRLTCVSPVFDGDELGSEDNNADGNGAIVDQLSPADSNKRNQNELIQEADNVGDSEDSEDEWNFYRPGNDNKANEEIKNPAQEEVSACENETESCKVADNFLIEKQEQHEESGIPADNETPEDKTQESPDLIKSDIEAEASSRTEEDCASTNPDNEEKSETDNMSFHLNPDAAEFVPVTTPPGMHGSCIDHLSDFPISGSPLKRRSMENIRLPSATEFYKEVSRRPSEIGDFSNGETTLSPQKNFADLLEEEAVEQLGPRGPISAIPMNLDDTDVSSTKAEFGDENSFMTGMGDFQTPGGQVTDYSFSDMGGGDTGEYDIAKDPMAMSFTPGDFQEAFSNDELNKVHDISDSEPCEENQMNGSKAENDEAQSNMFDYNNFTAAVKTPEVTSPVDEVEKCSWLDFGVKEKADEDNEKCQREEPIGHEERQLESPENETAKTEDERVSDIVTPEEEERPQNPFSADFVPLEHNQLEDFEHSSVQEFEQNPVQEFEHKQELEHEQVEEFEHKSEPEFEHKQEPVFEDKPVDEFESEPAHEVEPESVHEFKSDLLGEFKHEPVQELEHEPVQELEHEPVQEFEHNSAQELEHDLSQSFGQEHLQEFEHEMEREAEPKNDTMDMLTNAVGNVDLREEPALEVTNPFLSEAHPHLDPLTLAMETPQYTEATTPEEAEHEEPMTQVPAVCQLGANIADARCPLDEDMSNVENFGHAIDNAYHTTMEQTQVLPEDISTEMDTFDESKMQYHREQFHGQMVEETLHEKSAHLSESLQEFTKLEKEAELLKEDLVVEPKDVVEEEPIVEPVTPAEIPSEPEKPEIVIPEVEKPKVVTPEVSETETPEPTVAAPEVAVAVGSAVVAATAATVIAAKTAKTAAAKTTTKSTVAGKTTKSTPTSPTKPGIIKKSSTTTSSAATKPRTATSATKTATSTSTKTAPAKSAASATAAKTTRVSALSASAPKPKGATSPRVTDAKKPTTNGEAKPISKFTVASKTPASRTVGTTGAAKPGLVKSSAPTSRTSSTTTSTTAKPRPASGAPPKPAARPTTISASARPKTAPTAPLTRTRPPTTNAKSPMIDKQIKETANKQISSARNLNAAKAKPLTATATSIKRVSSTKTGAAPAATSPTKRPTGTASSKIGSKLNSVQAKVNSKPPTKTKVVVQNGVSEKKAPTNAVAEEDIPKKDLSPMEPPPTDNQLIITAE